MPKLMTKDPFTGQSTGEFEMDAFAQAQSKVATLTESQRRWSVLPLKQRLSLVQGALSYFEKNREAIATDICEQMGRPLHHSRGEINGLLERGNYLCAI